MEIQAIRKIEGHRRGNGWAVTLAAGDGSWVRFDRADGETAWYLAADSIPRSYLPNREHGDLSRCTLPVHPKPLVAAVLDAAVIDREAELIHQAVVKTGDAASAGETASYWSRRRGELVDAQIAARA